MGGIARTVGHQYDADGNRNRITHPDSTFFTYALDGLGRPGWIHWNGQEPVTYLAWDSAGRRALSAWGMATFAYDPAGRLQTIGHNPLGTDRDHVLGFAYNPAGQIVSRSGSNDAFAFASSPINIWSKPESSR